MSKGETGLVVVVREEVWALLSPGRHRQFKRKREIGSFAASTTLDERPNLVANKICYGTLYTYNDTGYSQVVQTRKGASWSTGRDATVRN